MEDKRIKVLYVVPRCAPAGVLHVLLNIVRHVDQRAFALHLITLEPELPDRSILAEFSRLVTCEHVPTSKLDGFLNRTSRLREAIDRFGPDVIHTSCAIPDIAVSRICPQKQLSVIHGDFKEDYEYTFGRVPGYVLARWELAAVRRAKKAVTVSESLSEIYARDCGLMIPSISNGVEVGPRWTGDKSTLRRRLGLPEDRTIFVSVGTLSKRKNQALMLETFEEGPQDGPLLLLLGGGEPWPRHRAEYTYSKNVCLPGQVSNVREYLRASDYYVSASRSEGLPLSVLEALAEGLPVLLSDIPPHREIVAQTGTGGELFRTDDADSLTKAIGRLLDRDRRQATADARTAAEEHFNAQLMSEHYQQLYRSL